MKLRWIFLGILVLVLPGPPCLDAGQSQSPVVHHNELESGTFKIAGTAVNAVTGEPLAHVRVSLSETRNRQRVISMITPENGHFEFSQIPLGKYSLQGAKRGFIPSAYEQHEQFSTAIVTGPEFQTEGLVLRMTPMALISGHVTDEFGEPVRLARVGLYLESHDGGMSRIIHINNSSSDDRGFFDFSPLRPGKYFVSVTAKPWYAVHPMTTSSETNGTRTFAENGASPVLDVVYPTTYYSGATEAAGATPLDVKGGDKVQIDVHLNPQRALHLIFRTPPGEGEQQNRSISYALQKRVFDSMEFSDSNIISQEPGVYELVGVAPGNYTIRTSNNQTGQGATAREVDVRRDNQEIDTSQSEPLGSLKLTIKMPGDEPFTQLAGIGLQDSRRRIVAFQQMNSNGQISFEDLEPGEYAILTNSTTKPYAVVRISSAAGDYEGHEVNITPGSSLELNATLSAGIASIEGVVHKKDKAVSGVMVALVPKDPATHIELFRRDQSDLDGTFLLRNVIPGSYTLIAVEDAWGFDWLTPGVLAKYAKRGQELTIGELMTGTVHLPNPVEVQAR
jgi:hypothetical protein